MITAQALRGRQKTLLRNYRELANVGDTKGISELIPRFLDNLEHEAAMYDYIGVDTSYYPIFFDNVFRSMGFKLFAGQLPSVSGVKPRYRTLSHFVAADSKRIIMFGSNPQTLFAEIADIQPVSPIPIIGLCYNTWSRVKDKENDEWAIENRRMATALGLSFLNLDSKTLENGIKLSSHFHEDEVKKLATKLGLPEMLSLSVENLAVYGTFQAARLTWPFHVKNFTSMCENSMKKGHDLNKGNLTRITPVDAINDPELFFKNLDELDLIKKKVDSFDVGKVGNQLINRKIVSTPQEAVLYDLSVNLRAEMKNGFNSILSQLKIKTVSYQDLEVYVENMDSFSKVRNISRSQVREVMLREDEIQTKLEEILNESHHKKDWGGETDDLYTSNLIINGERYRAAFLLKGSGIRGRLTIAKCGTNGDQIQRLFKCPADIFIIQHVSQIDEAVIEEAKLKTIAVRPENPKARFCIIDGIDTQRIMSAYS